MKRIAVLLLSLILIFLSACKENQTPPTDSCTIPSTPVTTGPTLPSTSATPTEATEPWEQYITIQYVPEKLNNGVTYTGLPAMMEIDYLVYDQYNLRSLSTERVDHAFGAASDGKPHHITVSNQQRFDQWGTSALAWDNLSQDKVLYLTFDCGYEYQNLTAQMLDILHQKEIKVTFFCTMDYLCDAPQVVARMITEGHHVGNHSLSHPSNSAALSREELAMEALAVENHLRVNFGYSSQYFRFPGGVHSENAVELLKSVGYRSVFWSIAYADWDPENQMGTDKAFQTVTSRLHPGAVILLHTTSPDNVAILSDLIDYAIAQGYQFRSLDDYPGWNET